MATETGQDDSHFQTLYVFGGARKDLGLPSSEDDKGQKLCTLITM